MSLRLAFYGDDFTGSTDALGVLADAGVRVRLFLQPPPAQALEPDLEVVGVAGHARSLSPEEMDQVLPPVLRALADLGPALLHYKVCSTFDSSPTAGSIGRVLEIGQDLLGTRPVPILPAAPSLGRYCAFGNLFARAGDGQVHRLDRHPTMRRHPVTPMDEADLRLHLGRQTARGIGLLAVPALRDAATAAAQLRRLLAEEDPDAILLDGLDAAHLRVLGGLLAELARGGPALVIGSSGVEEALVRHWGERPAPAWRPAAPGPLAVVSGSCSPVTAAQIDWAERAGFAVLPLDTPAVCTAEGWRREVAAAAAAGRQALAAGRSVVVHTSRGPDDPRIAAATAALRRQGGGVDRPGATALLFGSALGAVLSELVAAGARRLVVAGGDTSAAVARALEIASLEQASPLAPGAPLCRLRSPGRAADGCEIVFKGGQMGAPDFFGATQSVGKGVGGR